MLLLYTDTSYLSVNFGIDDYLCVFACFFVGWFVCVIQDVSLLNVIKKNVAAFLCQQNIFPIMLFLWMKKHNVLR